MSSRNPTTTCLTGSRGCITEIYPGMTVELIFFLAQLLEGLLTIQKEDGELVVGLTFHSKLK